MDTGDEEGAPRYNPQERLRISWLAQERLNKLFEVGCTEKEAESITGQSAAMVAHYSKRANQLKLARSATEKMEGRK